MSSTVPELISEPVEVMEVTPATETAKKINILDTKLAIRPFKTSPDGLEAFVQACHRKKTGGSTPEMFGIHFKRVVNNKLVNPPQLDHLSFLKYYEIVLKCKQERSVSTGILYVMRAGILLSTLYTPSNIFFCRPLAQLEVK